MRRDVRFRNLLMEPLMRSSMVEVCHILIEHALELPLVKDQDMIKAFLSHTPQEAFADRIGSWRMIRRFENLNRIRCRHASKARPKFAIVITNQILRRLPYGLASRSCCATQESVGDRVTPTWITFRDVSSMINNVKSSRKNKSVTC